MEMAYCMSGTKMPNFWGTTSALTMMGNVKSVIENVYVFGGNFGSRNFRYWLVFIFGFCFCCQMLFISSSRPLLFYCCGANKKRWNGIGNIDDGKRKSNRNNWPNQINLIGQFRMTWNTLFFETWRKLFKRMAIVTPLGGFVAKLKLACFVIRKLFLIAYITLNHFNTMA